MMVIMARTLAGLACIGACLPVDLSHVGAITMRKQGCAPQRDDCMASVRGLQNDGHHGQDAPHSSCCHDEAIQAVLHSCTGNAHT